MSVCLVRGSSRLPNSAELLGVTANVANRGRLIALALTLLGLSYLAARLLDVPTDGVAYFAFLPIALVALVAGPVWGSLVALSAGTAFATLRPEAVSLESELITTVGAVRMLAYIAVAALIGKFAGDSRSASSRLENLAHRDALTALRNGRSYRNAVARLVASGRGFALVIGDLDGLKRINDAHGHQAGDEALQRLARALAHAVREDDHVARIGGDEFSILARGADAHEASALCSRLQRDLSELEISASFGWAIYPADGTDARTLFRQADARLYQRKRFRDQVGLSLVSSSDDSELRAAS